jgi:hypothetical protein
MSFMQIETPEGERLVVQNTSESLPREGEHLYAYDGKAHIVERVEWRAHREPEESGIDRFSPTVIVGYLRADQ